MGEGINFERTVTAPDGVHDEVTTNRVERNSNLYALAIVAVAVIIFAMAFAAIVTEAAG